MVQCTVATLLFHMFVNCGGYRKSNKGMVVYDESEQTCKEVVVIYFSTAYCPGICLEGDEETPQSV
jgi:hypothetical protein